MIRNWTATTTSKIKSYLTATVGGMRWGSTSPSVRVGSDKQTEHLRWHELPTSCGETIVVYDPFWLTAEIPLRYLCLLMKENYRDLTQPLSTLYYFYPWLWVFHICIIVHLDLSIDYHWPSLMPVVIAHLCMFIWFHIFLTITHNRI